jgi:peptidoglycan pentaglycine glycine transferase (the first glycine)
MEIKRILDEKTWEQFVLSQTPHTPFFQSWAWGQFQDALGLVLYRFGLYDGERLIGGAQALGGKRKLGRYIYVPHGPLIEARGRRQEAETEILEHLKRVAKEEGADYLRVEPAWERGDEGEKLLQEAGFRQAVAPSQAGGTTLILDLRLPEEDLLAGMRKTTRYLVRKGIKMGVRIERTRDPEKMQSFHRLMATTYERHKFTPHTRNYHQTQFETLAPRRMSELYLASHDDQLLAAAIIITYGDSASYLHGASVRSEVPASHFLQWEAIKQAKKSDLDYYDLWGISPTDDPRHPWYGYSLFKKGFGGRRLDYTGAWDYPLTKRYFAVAGGEWLWRKRHHL